MAKDQSKRLTPAELASDKEAFDALKGVAGYAPSSAQPQLTVANVTTLLGTMTTNQATETQTEAAYKTARDKAVAAEWAFHNAILGCKDQVRAQFGKDSNELQAMGLKKTSEYKKRSPRKK
jgi:hypothetical protein